jgi:hypothetical protein
MTIRAQHSTSAPHDEAYWEQAFWDAFFAMLQMETRAEVAEATIAQMHKDEEAMLVRLVLSTSLARQPRMPTRLPNGRFDSKSSSAR